ncbi:DUF4037 domain-containing protein [Virgibacillus halophilus]|uniref:DUF4037 domain-containing protein n=1 Tax=Tigheibacillus halophilus TaxID=361280 RepID=A0ABU5C8K3_9BACI|nr:DUF4037 domain-containing protein [Virgibacillus halophilus]
MNLKTFASEVSKVYKQNPKVEAVLLGGSVARGWQDEHSDIELFVLWNVSPTEEDRNIPINHLHGHIIDFHPYEEEEWSESFITQGVKLEISNFLTNSMQKVINDVIIDCDTDLHKQCLVASVHDGISLAGEEIMAQLKKKVEVYPKELSGAMIRSNMYLGSKWDNRKALLDREDWLLLYKLIVSAQENLMGVLFGLNQLYVHHPVFKWQQRSLEKMKIVPENLSYRLTAILLEHPRSGLRELEMVIQEIYQLVQKAYPSMDLSKFMDDTLFLRPKNTVE